LGTIIQKYRPRLGSASVGFQTWIDEINTTVKDKLFPQLQTHKLTLEGAVYNQVDYSPADSFCLEQIPDFNTLAATSQSHKRPVFALSDQMFGHVGSVLEQDQIKRGEFHQLFSAIADKLIILAGND
jgi:hypothetical protein